MVKFPFFIHVDFCHGRLFFLLSNFCSIGWGKFICQETHRLREGSELTIRIKLKIFLKIDAIIENLPKQRQTLLFSATQTKRVEDLVRVSLNDPVFVSAHEGAKNSTPDQLTQVYIFCLFFFNFGFVKSNNFSLKILFLGIRRVRYYWHTLIFKDGPCWEKMGPGFGSGFQNSSLNRVLDPGSEICLLLHAILFNFFSNKWVYSARFLDFSLTDPVFISVCSSFILYGNSRLSFFQIFLSLLTPFFTLIFT